MPGNGNGQTKTTGAKNASINVINGSAGNDIIGGTDGADEIHGGDGLDTIYGFGGDDIIYGDADDDWIHPGTGNDTIYGGDGTDIVEYEVIFVEEPQFKDGKGKNAGSVQITYTYEQDGQLITETDTLWDVEAVVYLVDAGGSAGGAVLDLEAATTGFYEADTPLGTGIVALSDSGFYLLATSTAGGGSLENAMDRIEDQDGGGDLEFRISTDADGTTHEINVQSSFDLPFDFVSAEVEGLDPGEQVLISIAVDNGFFSPITVLQVDATAAAADGVIEASELVGLPDANANLVQASDLEGIDQLMIEAGNTAGDDTFWIDNIELA